MKKYSTTIIILLIVMSVSFDAHGQWVTLNPGTSDDMQQVFFPNDSLGYLLGSDGNIFATSDGGQSWSNPGSVQCSSIFFTSIDTGYGCDGLFGSGIYQTTDGATTWNSITSTDSLNDYITSFSFPGSGNIGYAAGSNSNDDSLIIYKTTDRGNIWNRSNGGQFSIAAVSIFFTDNNTGYLTDAFSGILKTIDGGFSWNNQYTDTSVSKRHSILAIYFPAADTGYAVGDSGTILKTTNGVNWFYMPQNVTYNAFTSVWFTSSQRGYAADESGNIIETNDGGQNWISDLNAGMVISSLYFSSPEVGYACGGGGEILKYSLPTGLKGFANDNKILLYPNPAASQLIIHFSSPFSNETAVSITNVLGEVVKIENGNYGNELNENVKDFPAGIYFVRVTSSADNWVGKFVKE